MTAQTHRGWSFGSHVGLWIWLIERMAFSNNMAFFQQYKVSTSSEKVLSGIKGYNLAKKMGPR